MEGIKRSLLFALFLIMCTLVQAQRLTVQGKVVSKTDGESIIGATVIETNQTSNGTITDIDGNFTLSVPQGAELSISYIGFKTVNVKAQATLNIVLEEESELLQEVVVTGYTTQRKADLTGANLRSQHRTSCQSKTKTTRSKHYGTRPRYEHHATVIPVETPLYVFAVSGL